VSLNIRAAAVAGTWYPSDRDELTTEVDEYLRAAGAAPRMTDLVALIAPHAGLIYSGPVAAHAYRQLRDRAVDTLVLVGPSHFVSFEGVAVYGDGGFASPLGTLLIDEAFAGELVAASTVVHDDRRPHRREHSLEMQIPFIGRLAPHVRIVPLLVGRQTAETAQALGQALAQVARGKRALLVASTDLSHYEDATTAEKLDAVVLDHVARLDPEGLQSALTMNPHHACGGGPAVAVMRAARELGASESVVLRYGDSGDISGDKSSVVGYMAAAMGRQ
jgi:AmmeMemoRadiSam system protein B